MKQLYIKNNKPKNRHCMALLSTTVIYKL